MERKFAKEPEVGKQFKEKFDGLTNKGVMGYVGKLKDLRHMYGPDRVADKEHILCPLQIVTNTQGKMRIVLDASYPNQLLYSGKLLLP